MTPNPSSHARQVIGSLLVALLIVAVTIAVVTAELGADGRASSDRGRQEHSGPG